MDGVGVAKRCGEVVRWRGGELARWWRGGKMGEAR